MNAKVINFKAKDGIILDGILYENKLKTDKVLIQIHGMTSNCFKKRSKIIANTIANIGIDTIDFNNRGSDIIKYISDGNSKRLAGTAYENIEECYADIVGAIEFATEIGYTEIFLQGHSLGCTKILYTYNQLVKEKNGLLEKIKGVILLSLVDIVGTIEKDADMEFIKYAEDKEKNNEMMEMMPSKSFIHPMSVKNYLMYTKYNENIDFARYDKKDNSFEVLNSIKCPLFMRWGNVFEIIKQDAKELTEFLNDKIKNNLKDISYIDGADHGYHAKEEQLATEICKFLQNILCKTLP